MSETLYSIDLWLFRFGNETLANPVFDVLLPFLTNERYFLVPYILLLAGLLWKGGRNGRICVAVVLLTVLIGDQLNSNVIKEVVGRIRPCHVLTDVRLLVPCGAGKSFPSSHAVNNFAAAIVFSFFYLRARPYILAFAALVGYTRVYCGVHYPFDVLGGAAEGTLLALLVLWLWYSVSTVVPKIALPYSPAVFFGAGAARRRQEHPQGNTQPGQ